MQTVPNSDHAISPLNATGENSPLREIVELNREYLSGRTAIMKYRDRWAVDDPVLDCAIEIVERKLDYDAILDRLYAESDECRCRRIDVDLDDNRGCPLHDPEVAAELRAEIRIVEEEGWAR